MCTKKKNYQFVGKKWENVCLHFLMQMFSCKPKEWMREPERYRQGLSQPLRYIGWWMPLHAHRGGSLGSCHLSKSQAQTTAAYTSYQMDEEILLLLFQLWRSASSLQLLREVRARLQAEQGLGRKLVLSSFILFLTPSTDQNGVKSNVGPAPSPAAVWGEEPLSAFLCPGCEQRGTQPFSWYLNSDVDYREISCL